MEEAIEEAMQLMALKSGGNPELVAKDYVLASELPGVKILGMLDDDETMVGTSPTGFPWTAYIMADVPDRETVRLADGRAYPARLRRSMSA